MRPTRMLAAVACALACSVMAAARGQDQHQEAQEPQSRQQAQRPYQPEIGQEGKDVVWVPTSDTMVEKMLDLAEVTPADYVLDLGSGDGRTVIAAARRGARAHGIEYNPEMVELSRGNAEAAGVTSLATFERADLFEADLSKATVITMFLLPSINLELRPKLLAMAPGTRIVSNTFDMEGWKPDRSEVVTKDCANYCTALLWVVPARVEGTWQLPRGRRLRLAQTFQVVSGALVAGGTRRSLVRPRLRGDHLTFTAGGARYDLRVTGDTMRGTVTTGRTKGEPIEATRVTS
ncbi:MAG TPA: class I SAM-dependent methyltransferase [Vicinamibacterales bacterium]|nr:class I SAM-dependent methyltransferase [Vicinamibacterales bacterium]